MGLNICAYLIEGRSTESGFSGRDISYLNTVKFEGFDSCRYSGDREFALTREIEWDEIWDDEVEKEGRSYNRPKDLSKAKEWVKKNVIECNQPRLLRLFDDMGRFPNLYLFFSW